MSTIFNIDITSPTTFRVTETTKKEDRVVWSRPFRVYGESQSKFSIKLENTKEMRVMLRVVFEEVTKHENFKSIDDIDLKFSRSFATNKLSFHACEMDKKRKVPLTQKIFRKSTAVDSIKGELLNRRRPEAYLVIEAEDKSELPVSKSQKSKKKKVSSESESEVSDSSSSSDSHKKSKAKSFDPFSVEDGVSLLAFAALAGIFSGKIKQ